MARLDYAAPGVYVEEVSRGSRPIQGISMSVAGFVGFTEDIRNNAEIYRPTLITNWSQYLENFAKLGSDGFTNFGAYLPFAVKGWFENGGGRCWVVSLGTELPIPHTDEDAADRPQLPSFDIMTTSQRPSMQISLAPEAAASGRITVVIQSDEPAEPAPDSDTELFDTGEYFQMRLMRHGEALKHPVLDEQGNVRMEEAYRHLTMAEQPETGTNVVAAFAESEYIRVAKIADPGLLPVAQRPANGYYEISPPQEDISITTWNRRIYGTRKNRSGVQGLFEIDEVSMVACPDLMLAYEHGFVSLEQVHGVMEAMITGCETAAPSPPYRMAVLDAPPVKVHGNSARQISPEQQKPQDVGTWLENSFNRRSPFAALYYPWIKVLDPRSGQSKFVPPCGHMMGIWCRTDELRGIHKAPANEVPRGILGLAYETNFREQEFLNPRGINCIRKFRDRGHLVWGARTLAQLDDIDWRYISVRRLMSYLEKSIELGTQWAVFEPNDEDLWARVTRTVRNFLERIWREGALFGATPEEAFYVRCDAELNTPETMKLGLLYIEVGVAPVRPAEFVVFRVSQWDPTQGQARG